MLSGSVQSGQSYKFAYQYSVVEITESTITHISGIEKLGKIFELPVRALCSFWYDMKTSGKVSVSNPRDFFDEVFNNPDLLDGQNPYANNAVPVPFNPFLKPPMLWHVGNRSGLDATIRSRLLGALLINDNDLTEVASYLLALLGIKGQPLPLTLHNMTWLYRLTRIPNVYGITIDEYLLLLCLMYYPDKPYLDPPVGGLPESISSVFRIVNTVKWMLESSFTPYQLRYVIKGTPSEYVESGLLEGEH